MGKKATTVGVVIMTLFSCGGENLCQRADLILCEHSYATEYEMDLMLAAEQYGLEKEGWIPCFCVWWLHDDAEAYTVGFPKRSDGGWKAGRCDGHRRILFVNAFSYDQIYTLGTLLHELGHAYGLDEDGARYWARHYSNTLKGED